MCHGEAEAATPPHVVLLSSTGMGHVAPLAELARRQHEAHGFTATVITDASSDAQRALLASLPPAVGAASLPPVPLDDLPAGSVMAMLLSVEARRSVPALAAVLADLRSRTGNLVAFVADTLRAARDAGVPGYLFFPSNLLMLSLMLHLPRLDAEPAAESSGTCRSPSGSLAACRSRGPTSCSRSSLQHRASDACRWMVHHGESYRDAAGILVNTFDAAEPGAAAVLRQPEPWRPPVYPVGPITRRATTAADGDTTGCVEWLDAQPEWSVLFVSFGSRGALSAAQTRELVHGLELSGTRFVCVVRSPVDAAAAGDGGGNPGKSYYDGSKSTYDVRVRPAELPPGRVRGEDQGGGPRGAVVGAAGEGPRAPHRATMATLTHRGWNSVLESVVSGVPMVAWPLYAEQRQNAVMLCEETRAALRPQAGGAEGMILAEDIAEVVKEMMHGEKGAAARAKVAELREAAASALEPGGVFYETLAEVVSKWKGATY